MFAKYFIVFVKKNIAICEDYRNCKLFLFNMRNFTLILVTICFSLFLFASCESNNTNDCEVNKYGTIQVSNSSTDPYDIWVDGTYQGRVNGKGLTNQIRIYEGNNVKLYAKQVSGFLFFPTEKTDFFNVVRCSKYSWMIP